MTDVDTFIIGDSPGACLKNAREQQGLSIAEVCRRLYLEAAVIEALEADDADQLPAAAYVRGYLRSYARLLGVSADSLLAMYQDGRALRPPEIIPQIKPRQASSGDKPVVAFSYFLAFVLLLLALAWWQSKFMLQRNELTGSSSEGDNEQAAAYQSNDRESTITYAGPPLQRAAENEAKIRQAPTADPTPANPAQDPLDKLPDNPLADPPARPQPTDAEPPLIAPAQQAMQQASQGAGNNMQTAPIENNAIDSYGSGPDTLEIRLYADSWIEVFDSADEQVYRDLGRGQQTLLLYGAAPFSVLIGFAEGVTLRFNGRDIDPRPFIKDGIARLSLGN